MAITNAVLENLPQNCDKISKKELLFLGPFLILCDQKLIILLL